MNIFSSKSRFGFTLIELLISMTIMGILLAISVSSYQSAQMRQRDIRRKADVLKIQSSLETYKSVNGAYGPEFAASTPKPPIGGCSVLGQLGGYYVVSTPTSATLDPMFVPDANSSTNGTGFLLAYMSKPNYIRTTAPIPTKYHFPQCQFNPEVWLPDSRIGYAVYKNQYWIYMPLENKNEPRMPQGNTCYHFEFVNNPADAILEFRDVVFNAMQDEGTNGACDGYYKLFARGSLNQLSQ